MYYFGGCNFYCVVLYRAMMFAQWDLAPFPFGSYLWEASRSLHWHASTPL